MAARAFNRPISRSSLEIGFEPTVRITAQRLSSSMISHADLSHPVPKRVVWFAIPKPMILVCDAQCHAVPCSWFAIWFANFLEVRQLGRGS